MTPRPDRLAEEFVEAAFELHRRRLWDELPADAILLVRVPTEDLPMAAYVMGQGGEEFGLGLVRGESAFRRMAGMCMEQAPFEEFADAGDLLSVTFEPWSELSEEFRRLSRSAGLQPRRERLVPMTLAKRPYEIARPAGRKDLRTLLWVLRGVFAAHDAGDLRPTTLPVLDPERREVLELEIGGELKKPTLTARIVPWPDDADSLDWPPLVALPDGLEGLPRLDQRWLVAQVHMAAEIRGDDRAVAGIFVAEESSRLILSNELVLGNDLAPAADALTQAFRGDGLDQRPGLPREIVFDSPRLHRSLTPALAGIGIEAVLDDACPALIELYEALESAAPEFSEDDGDPETLQEWKAVDLRVATELTEELLDKNRMTEKTLKRYFGTAENGEEVLERFENYSPFGAFAEWLASDYRATKRSKTLVEKLLEKKTLDPAQRVALEARRDALLSIFRFDSCHAGTIDVEDVLSGRHFTIHDKGLSENELEGIFLPLRLLFIKDWIFPVIAGPPLAALRVDSLLQSLEDMGAELTAEGLRRDAHLMGRLWLLALAPEETTHVFQNTDGDPLEPRSATFKVKDPAALQRFLKEHDDVEFDEREGRWVWLRPGPEEAQGGRTVFGHLDILGDRILLEVNSQNRLQLARKWLQALTGVRFERATVHELDRTEPLDDRLPGPPAKPLTPEEIARLERTVHDQCIGWLDERVPLLGDLTPRQACATEEGRQRVARLVRTMPAVVTPHGSIRVPRDELLRQLGLSAKE